MAVYIHADDFGLTSGINHSILEVHQHSVLHSVSIIPNGYAFEEAIAMYHQHTFDIHVHLNFIEGKPLHPDTKSSFLVDSENEFSLSFITLLRKTILINGNVRDECKRIIKNEMYAQIKKVQQHLKSGSRLCIDSHQHVHMIPLFWEALSELIHEMKIDYIRIPNEAISLFALGADNLFSSGWLKVFLLRLLSSKAQLILPEDFYTRHFIGVLYTGKMTLYSMQKNMKYIQHSSLDIEVLLHPGQAVNGEENYWTKYPYLKKYYFSADRLRERNVLKSNEFKEWVNQLQNKK